MRKHEIGVLTVHLTWSLLQGLPILPKISRYCWFLHGHFLVNHAPSVIRTEITTEKCCSAQCFLWDETYVKCVEAFFSEMQALDILPKFFFFLRNFGFSFFFFFADEPWPWQPWKWWPKGGFGGGLPKKNCSKGVARPVFDKTLDFGVRLPKLDQLTVAIQKISQGTIRIAHRG
jgi:hypothetical protein